MKVVPEKNAVRILWGRERGTRAMGAQRLLQELVEDKTRWMKWEGKVRKWMFKNFLSWFLFLIFILFLN
jgi:hypothetical protein